VAIILDASALLANLRGEPEEALVATAMESGATVLTVNIAEVATVLVRLGVSVPDITQTLNALLIDIVNFDLDLAIRCGKLISITKPFGLSLADRACLALAQRTGESVLTADRAWAKIADAAGVTIHLLRPKSDPQAEN